MTDHPPLAESENWTLWVSLWCCAFVYSSLVLLGYLPDPVAQLEATIECARARFFSPSPTRRLQQTGRSEGEPTATELRTCWSPWGPMDTEPHAEPKLPLPSDADRPRGRLQETAREEAERAARLDALLNNPDSVPFDSDAASPPKPTTGRTHTQSFGALKYPTRRANAAANRLPAWEREFERTKKLLGWHDAAVRAGRERGEQERKRQQDDERARYSETPEEWTRRLDRFGSIFRQDDAENVARLPSGLRNSRGGVAFCLGKVADGRYYIAPPGVPAFLLDMRPGVAEESLSPPSTGWVSAPMPPLLEGASVMYLFPKQRARM